MKIHRYGFYLFIYFIFFVTCLFPKQVSMASEQTEDLLKTTDLYAKAAVLMDGETGRVLYGKEEATPLANASTTKIMTCILALEYCKLEDKVEVSPYAASMPDVQLNIQVASSYQLKDLLYSLMLESHNDSAVAIAEHVVAKINGENETLISKRTVEESKQAIANFSNLMNEKAKQIGCVATHFVTPNGLDSTSYTTEASPHQTTAVDLANIMRYCVDGSVASKEFLTITQTSSYCFTDELKQVNYSLNNHNRFLTMMKEAVSGKTGFTNKAGYCYVGAVKKEGKFLVVALLACGWPPNKSYKWSDMKTLIDYGLKNYEKQEIGREGFCLTKLPVKEGKQNSLFVYACCERLSFLVKKGEEIKISWQINQNNLYAPVEKGKQVGWLHYSIGEYLAGEFPLVVKEGVQVKKWWEIF